MPAAGNVERNAIAALGAAEIILILRSVRVDARLQERESNPVAAVQGKLADGVGVNEAAQSRTRGVNLRRLGSNFYLFGYRSHSEREIYGDVGADGDVNATAYFGLEA